MGELKGMMYSIFIFIAFVLPVMLSIYTLSIRTDQFMKTTSEITQSVQGYGGYTTEFIEDNGGFTIGDDPLLVDCSCKIGKVAPGTEIELIYEYSYEGYYGMSHDFSTTDRVTIFNR